MAATRDTLFNFRRDTDTPLDDWIVVADLSARDAIPSGVRHLGQLVFVEANNTNYQLTGGIENSNWAVPAGGSGQTSAQVDAQIDAIRTSGELITFPNGMTFTGGGDGGGGNALTAETILAVLNAATGSIDGDLLANAMATGSGITFQPTDSSTVTLSEGDIVVGTLAGFEGNVYLIGANPPTLTAASNFANAAFGTVRGSLLNTTYDSTDFPNTQLTQAEVQSLQLQPIPNTDTQLTAETILGIINAADGSIDADLLTLATGTEVVLSGDSIRVGPAGTPFHNLISNTQISTITANANAIGALPSTFAAQPTHNGDIARPIINFTGGTYDAGTDSLAVGTGGDGGGGGDTITFNFARNGSIRSAAVGSGDAGRTYITIISPTGVGDANDNVDWSIVQNYRLGNAVFTRSYTLDNSTDDVAYARRDEIVTNRAVDTFDTQTYITK